MGEDNGKKRFSNEFWLTIVILALTIGFSAGGVVMAFETQSHAAATYETKEDFDKHEKSQTKRDDNLREDLAQMEKRLMDAIKDRKGSK